VQIQTSRAAHDATYRPGVGIVLLNTGNQVFVGRRIDVEDAWQMPQGGIEPGETPREAALRELREEIGTNDVEILAESSRWFYYDVPEEFARKGLEWSLAWTATKMDGHAVLGVETAQSMLRPLIRNSMPGAGCNRRNCPRSPSLSSVVSTSAFLQSFPRYSETRGLERYPERSPAIATHRHGRSFIQNWAHLEI
jgi:ADP-ribose pyrophosphatase YjhB (NUDIX family)